MTSLEDGGRGNLWQRMNAQRRRAGGSLSAKDIPIRRGVYAWYHDGQPVYSGRALGAEGLRGRIWKNHLKTGNDLSRSSFRRNVCEHLAIAPTAKTTIRPTVLTATDVEPVNRWIRECDVAWIDCQSVDEARHLRKHYIVSGSHPSPEDDGCLARLQYRSRVASHRTTIRRLGRPRPDSIVW